MFTTTAIKAQCFQKVKYKIIEDQNAIEIQFSQDYDLVEINLENALLRGNDQFEKTSRIKNVSGGLKYIVFKNLQPSKYLIQLVAKDCKWIIGGLEGIIIKEKDEK